MADTKHAAVVPPVEGDGVNYRGIVWFVVILVGTTVVCQALMWLLFIFLDKREVDASSARPTISVPVGQPPPPPNLLYVDTQHPDAPILGEPDNLHRFRQSEETILHSYGWVDQNAGVVRIPIDRAKDLLIERGLPVQGAAAPAPATKVKK